MKLATIPQDTSPMIKDKKYNQCHLSTSVSVNLLTKVSDFRWLAS